MIGGRSDDNSARGASEEEISESSSGLGIGTVGAVCTILTLGSWSQLGTGVIHKGRWSSIWALSTLLLLLGCLGVGRVTRTSTRISDLS